MNKEDIKRRKKLIDQVIKQYPVLAPIFDVKGNFVTIKTRKKLKTYKGVESEVIKETVINGRAGLSHNERRSVIIGRILGNLPITNIGLPYGAWKIFPYIIENKNKLLLRTYPIENAPPQYKYFLNNIEVDRDTVEPLCLASEFNEHNLKTGCINLSVENVREIHFKND